MRGILWLGVLTALVVPVVLAAYSPFLQWREPVYIVAGFAGIVALALLFLQPLLAGGYLAGLEGPRGRRLHRWVGIGLLVAVVVHVIGLWITSPPDVIDALTFTSPTPFSAWGVVAMWAVFAVALLVVLRRRLRWRPQVWRHRHAGLATVTAVGTVVHALLIEGAMEPVSKAVLCALVLGATALLWYGLLRRARR
ncbi:MAG: ferric reductase-like transmembrane domain-containing protein [Pseudomonadota bacterium]